MTDTTGLILKLLLLIVGVITLKGLVGNTSNNIESKVPKGIAPMITIAVIIIALIVYFGIVGFDLTPVEDPHIEKIVDVEGFDNIDLETGFCKHHEGDRNGLNESCGQLTKDSCMATDCCVYAKMRGEEKCFAGDKHGPTFRRNANGKTYDIDFYYFKDKCYGAECPE